MKSAIPVFDLHCDLLSYLAKVPHASINATADIGVTLPYLIEGNVKYQVLAIFAPTGPGSVALGQKQVSCFQDLARHTNFTPISNYSAAAALPDSDQIGITVAIENASVLADETEGIENAFQRLDKMIESCQRVIYIGFTHHYENRFGGGNYSDNIGLKPDGERLLEYMAGKGIAIDLAHTSDRLAYDIVEHLEKKNLQVPLIASHSNFRHLFPHVRNLPLDLVAEILKRKGLIGMNFLRAYIHDTDPDYFLTHIEYGLREEVANNHLAFGADFFYRPGLSDPARQPLFFDKHMDAGKYPTLLQQLAGQGIEMEDLEKLSYKNVLAFMKRVW